MVPIHGLHEEYLEILDEVSLDLPVQLLAKLDVVRERLAQLFRPSYPMILQHIDLGENNFHVDEATGHITGKFHYDSPYNLLPCYLLWCSLVIRRLTL